MKDTIYLGDGVYAAQDGFHIWIWTEDGISKSTPIALESPVLDALFAYRSRLLEEARAARAVTLQDAENSVTLRDAEDSDATD